MSNKTFKEWYDTLPANQQKETFKKLCAFLDKTPAHVKRNWINGDKIPGAGDRLAIEKFTGGVVVFPITKAA